MQSRMGVGGPLAASLSPSAVYGLAASGIITTGACACTATGGAGAYTYTWTRTSGSTLATATSPNSSSTTFRANPGSSGTVANFKCTVSDGVTSVDSGEVVAEFDRP